MLLMQYMAYSMAPPHNDYPSALSATSKLARSWLYVLSLYPLASSIHLAACSLRALRARTCRAVQFSPRAGTSCRSHCSGTAGWPAVPGRWRR
eukprot:scaffold3878_cov363-Prasinococcus_capsulatus_cf.AAC.2